MTMTEWARNEIDLACKRERGDAPAEEWDYGCACYESALKAFESLMNDGHSGMSINITKNILMRLIDGKPLTPIDETDDVWRETYREDDSRHFQCKRMPSFFKDVYPDGTVKYTDIDRFYCVDRDNPNCAYSTGLVRDIIDEMFPIKMPYSPQTKPYKVFCETFLFNPNNGDFDTRGVLYLIDPDGEKVQINRYFAEIEGEFKEISEAEYMLRRKLCLIESAKKKKVNLE